MRERLSSPLLKNILLGVSFVLGAVVFAAGSALGTLI
jgi:hypothetical protein